MTYDFVTVFMSFATAFGIVVYTILDGFDLGVASSMLFLERNQKDDAASTISHVWDGNETWLLFVSACLIGAFPLVYYTVLPFLYLPVMGLIFALGFRAVSLEFRMKVSDKYKHIWNTVFSISSILASFLQGATLGVLFYGQDVDTGVILGGEFGYLRSFPLFCGFAVVVAHGMLGLSWIIYKSQGDLQLKCRVLFRKYSVMMCAIFIFAAIAIFSIFPRIFQEAFFGYKKFSSICSVSIGLFSLFLAFYGVKNFKNDIVPFLLTSLLFSSCLVNLVFILWPFILFPVVTIFDARNVEYSIKYVFILSVIMMPVVIFYTCVVYYKFRGKISSKTVKY